MSPLWQGLAQPTDNPRRAGVSAFGFGGTNFHVALEQYHPEKHSKLSAKWRSRKHHHTEEGDAHRPTSLSWAHLKALEGGVLLVNGNSEEALLERLGEISAELFDGTPTFDDHPTGKRLSRALPLSSLGSNPRASGSP